MAHYFELADLEALIPNTWLLGALDDDANGTAEMFEAARKLAEDEINGAVGLRYELPLDPVPLFISNSAAFLAAEICYARRGEAAAFPFAAKVKMLREALDEIAAGNRPLYPKSGGEAAKKGKSQAYVEPSKIHSSRTNC